MSLLTLDEKGDSHLYYHSQSSPRMKPGGRDNRWARWGPLACPAHPRGAHSQSLQPGLKTRCWKTVLLDFWNVSIFLVHFASFIDRNGKKDENKLMM